MSDKLWQGRFSERTAAIVEAFSASIQVDRRLYAYDIQGSIAHCKMLAKVAVITPEEAEAIIRGLEIVRQEIEDEHFEYVDSLEDIHMHIESRLIDIAGPVARKLHTARSRNDQIAVDTRMYLRDETKRLIHRLYRLEKVITDLARRHLDTVLPSYTHMQRAQPVLLSHHLMAYYEMFLRDIGRLEDCLTRINVMPLGSAAVAGTTFPIDRAYTAALLGFESMSANSIDAVADRDFVIEFLAAAALCMVHLSRLAEELILWSTSEFNFIELPDSFATGSSIMPQKKNPDVPELIRGKTAAAIGNLTTLLTLMKALPLAYNRDMQEDKVPLFDTVDTLAACIEICTAMLPEIKLNKSGMHQAASTGYLNATDLADYLATRGVAFRDAHRLAGEAVGFALARKKELHELSLEQLQSFCPLIRDDVYAFLTTAEMVDRRSSYGGTAARRVVEAIAAAENWIDDQSKRYSDL